MGIVDGDCRSGDERISSISSITNCDKYKGNDEEKFEFFAEVIGLHGEVREVKRGIKREREGVSLFRYASYLNISCTEESSALLSVLPWVSLPPPTSISLYLSP